MAARAKAGLGGFGARAESPIDLDTFLPYIVHRLWATIAAARSIKLSDGTKVRTREWRVLLILAAFGPLTSVEVARRSFMDTGSTARAVRTLVQRGFLVARTPKADRRKQVLAMTDAGAVVHDEIAAVREAYSRAVLGYLTPAEQGLFLELTARIQAGADTLQLPFEQIWLEAED